MNIKKIAIIFLLVCFGASQSLLAQIDPEYLLELKKGTTAEMNATIPAKGVLIFNTDADKVYQFDGTNWTAVSEDGDWSKSGNDQYSAVSGNVGVGTNTPTAKLDVNGIIRSTAQVSPVSGIGAELTWDGTYAVLRGYDRTNSAYQPVALSGSEIGVFVDGSQKMIVDNAGNVGIGITTPLEKLDVRGAVVHSGAIKSTGAGYTFPWMRFETHQWGNSTALGAGGCTIVGSGEFAWVAMPHFDVSSEDLILGADEGISFYTNTQGGWNANKLAIRIADNALVGIHTPSPTAELDVNGKMRIRDIPAGSTGQYLIKDSNGNVRVQASDRRLKKNIIPIDNALEKIAKLDGKYFDWKENGIHDIGFIAQDVEKVLPELVGQTTDGFKSLNYPQITAVLVNAIKELKNENTILRKQIKNNTALTMMGRISAKGDVMFMDDKQFVISRKAVGKYRVSFANAIQSTNYEVFLSLKHVVVNGRPVFISYDNISSNGFDVSVQSMDANLQLAPLDAGWSFNLKAYTAENETLEANVVFKRNK